MFSENIFKDIKQLIFDDNENNLGIRDEHKKKVLSFLKRPTPNTALSLYLFIADVHKKSYVFNLMDDLRLHEEGFKKIFPEHRDHYLHSASVYVLGLAIYNKCEAIRNACSTDRHEQRYFHDQKTSFLFRWSLAACLHDLAYPLELSLKSFNQYSRYLYEIKGEGNSFININPDIYEDINLLPIIQPDNDAMPRPRKDTALGLIAKHLTEHCLRNTPITYETLLEFLKKYINDNLAIGRIDHGIFSSLMILKRIHELYERNEAWDIQDYYYEVVDAATAVFLHNSYRHSKLKSIFGNGKFLYDYPNSLGYLLYLTDNLCEWRRNETIDHKAFGIFVDNSNIIFRAPQKVTDKIKSAAVLFDERVPVKITDRWTPGRKNITF